MIRLGLGFEAAPFPATGVAAQARRVAMAEKAQNGLLLVLVEAEEGVPEPVRMPGMAEPEPFMEGEEQAVDFAVVGQRYRPAVMGRKA